MQPVNSLFAPKRDPAPSRASYRFQRLWLTPVFRAVLRAGVPIFLLMILAGWYLSEPARIEAFRLQLSELRHSIEHRPEFMVNLMLVENVTEEAATDIREVTALDFPISSFDLDLEAMRVRIEELDAVAQAKLVVRSGGVLEVVVRERIPALVWRGREALELLDLSGHRVSSLKARGDRTDLPLIAGEGADQATNEALAIYRAARPIAGRLRGLTRVGERRWDMVLDRELRIMLPESDPVAALEHILALNEITDLLARDLVSIDLRDTSRPTLRLADDAIEALLKVSGAEDGDDAI